MSSSCAHAELHPYLEIKACPFFVLKVKIPQLHTPHYDSRSNIYYSCLLGLGVYLRFRHCISTGSNLFDRGTQYRKHRIQHQRILQILITPRELVAFLCNNGSFKIEVCLHSICTLSFCFLHIWDSSTDGDMCYRTVTLVVAIATLTSNTLSSLLFHQLPDDPYHLASNFGWYLHFANILSVFGFIGALRVCFSHSNLPEPCNFADSN
jgi:hypothetical protein